MYHIIYKTTNVETGKFYIGMHSTDDLNDGYLGSGLRLRRSVEKYGKEKHHREILYFTEDRKSLAELEKQIVNEELLTNPLCINLRKGGFGGVLPGEGNPFYGRQHTPETKALISKSGKGRQPSELNRQRNTELFKGKPLSEEHKEKIRAGNRGKSQNKSAIALENIHKAKCKQIELNGVVYESIKEAAISLGVCRNKIYKMLKEQE